MAGRADGGPGVVGGRGYGRSGNEAGMCFRSGDIDVVRPWGKVVATGTLEEVRANPDPWVQQFLNRVPEDESKTDGSYLRELIEPLGPIGGAK